jgi:hypothetical protein
MTLLTKMKKQVHMLVMTLALSALAMSSPMTAQADDRQIDALVGVWESVSPGQIDYRTRQPLPDAPIIRSVYTIHHGGTMSEENTDPIEGPYRVFFPDPVTSELGDAIFSGCFAATAHRLIF